MRTGPEGRGGSTRSAVAISHKGRRTRWHGNLTASQADCRVVVDSRVLIPLCGSAACEILKPFEVVERLTEARDA